MLFLLRVMSRKDAKGAKKKCVGDAKHVNPHNERSGLWGHQPSTTPSAASARRNPAKNVKGRTNRAPPTFSECCIFIEAECTGPS